MTDSNKTSKVRSAAIQFGNELVVQACDLGDQKVIQAYWRHWGLDGTRPARAMRLT